MADIVWVGKCPAASPVVLVVASTSGWTRAMLFTMSPHDLSNALLQGQVRPFRSTKDDEAFMAKELFTDLGIGLKALADAHTEAS